MKIAAPTIQMKAFEADSRKAPTASPAPADTVQVTDVEDAFNDPPGEKHRIGFEAASNVGSALGGMLEGAGKLGQAVEMGSLVAGLTPTHPAAFAALVGGTYDVARGAGITQMSAFNRNLPGAVLGSLQLTQGVATWVASGAALMGAPALVGQISAGAALLAYAGHQGYAQYLKHKIAHSKAETEEKAPVEEHKETDATHDLGRAPSVDDAISPSLYEAAALHDQFNAFGSGLHVMSVHKRTPDNAPGAEAVPKEGRGLEKTVAFTTSINEMAKKISGGVALFNTASVLFTGHDPGLGWGSLGVVGGTYNAAQGLAMLRHATGNLHTEDTVNGVFSVLTGAGQLGASMGLGRPAAGLALGAFVAQQAIGLYLKKKQLSGDGKEKSVTEHLADNLKQIWSPAQEESQVKKAVNS